MVKINGDTSEWIKDILLYDVIKYGIYFHLIKPSLY
jgi:hypothetical protein